MGGREARGSTEARVAMGAKGVTGATEAREEREREAREGQWGQEVLPTTWPQFEPQTTVRWL